MPTQTSLLARDDTFLGVCQGIGEDLGFNPLYLRLALTGLLFFHPLAALGLYAGAGLVVALSRRLHPVSRAAAEPATGQALVEAEAERDPLPLAA